jgi:hypothetical protein
MLVSDNNNASVLNRGKPIFSPTELQAALLPDEELLIFAQATCKSVYQWLQRCLQTKIDLYDSSDKRLRELDGE